MKKQRLMLNHSKTEFIAFSKNSKLEETKRNHLLIGNYKIPNVDCLKYPDKYLDCTLCFQEDLKQLLRKMATGIKTLNFISRQFPEQTRLLLLNAFAISHLHYSGLCWPAQKTPAFLLWRNN